MIAHIAFALALRHPPDTWFGPDKLKHFFVAAFTESVSYSLLQAARVKHDHAIAGAIGVTAAVSIAKEIRDWRSYGLFSVRDLAWDAAGAGAATLIIARSVRSGAREQPVRESGRAGMAGEPLLSVFGPGPILPRGDPPAQAPRR